MEKITSKEIAKMAGVSVSAVSIVLNNKAGVSDETRERILHFLLDNGILPKATSNGLSNGSIIFCKISKHGNIINDRHNVFLSDYIDGVVEEAMNLNYSVEFVTYNKQPINEIATLLKQSSNAIGCVVLSTELAESDIETMLSSIKIPCVFLDAYYNSISADFVTMDNFQMVYQAVQYFYNKGHRKIGMLSSRECSNFALREEAFRYSMQKLEILNENLIFKVRSTHQGSYEDVLKELKTFDKKKLPTAFFACNDMVAIGAIRAMQEIGLNVPNDISIIGFDNLPSSSLISPSLSSMAVPKKAIGKMALNILSSRILNPSDQSNKKVVLSGNLKERKSVKPISIA